MWRSEATGRCHEVLPKWRKISTLLLEGSKLFGSTTSVDCHSHQYDKVNYSIACPNTKSKRACTEESLNYAKHDVVHITLVLEIEYPSPIGTLQDLTQLCQKMLGDASQYHILCNSKVITSKYSTLLLRTKDWRRIITPTIMWSIRFGLA